MKSTKEVKIQVEFLLDCSEDFAKRLEEEGAANYALRNCFRNHSRIVLSAEIISVTDKNPQS